MTTSYTTNVSITGAAAAGANRLSFDSGSTLITATGNLNTTGILTVDGNAGIGTDSPVRTLHVVRDAASYPSGTKYALNQPVIIEDDNRPGIQLTGSANNIGIIEFGDPDHPNAGSINFDHSTDRLRFGFGDDAEKVYIDSSGNMVISGDLTVNGTTTTVSTANTVIEDKLLELGNGVTGTPSGDMGIVFERGSSTNVAIIWDESRDEFVLGTTTATGASTGDLTVTPGNISVERIGAGTEQAEAEVHAKRDASSGGTYSSTAGIISEDDARPAIQLVGSANNIGMIQFGDNAAAASGQIYYDHSTDKLRIDCGGNADRLTLDSSGNAVAEGSVLLKEKADAIADVAAYGQLWVKTATPNELYFTTDAGDDIQLTSGTSTASSGDITGVTAGTLLDGGGTSGGVTLNVDLTEAGEAAIADGDYILFLDGGATGTHAKEAIADVATLFAGTGLTATNSVIAVDAAQTQITSVGTLDAGAISSGFGNINIGSSNITATGDIALGETTITGHATIADGSYDFDVASHDGTNGLKLGGTLVAASAAEINAACDASGRTAATVDVAADHFLFCDGGATGATKVESIADLVSEIASTGLDAGSGQLSVDVSDFMTNGANNRVLTATGTDAMNGEANLTFDGSTLEVAGTIEADTVICDGLATKADAKTSNYECTSTDYCIIASRSITVTLPENSDAGTIYVVKRVDDGTSNGTVTVSRKTSDTIDGANTYPLDANYMSATFISDGANYHVVGSYEVPE